MKTLVIAETYDRAESVMKFFALKDPVFAKLQIEYVPRQPGVIDPDLFRSEYNYVSAPNARVNLQGSSYSRIIIASDYLRWGHRGWYPGALSELWHEIQAQRARGVQVVFA